MKILLTGAGGFVGGHLLATLRASYPQASLMAARLDVADREAVNATIEEFQPDFCFHLAAISSIGASRSDPDAAWRVNLGGTLNIAEALRRSAPNCLLVFPSSAETYGGSFKSGMALDENAALAPMNTYAATKAAADLALGALAQDGLRVVRLRPFNHTGPGQNDSFVVPAFALQIARIEAGLQDPVISVGNLDAQRDFLDVRDVCAAYAACIAPVEPITPGMVLNLASGQTRSISSMLHDLLRLSGVAAEVKTDPARLRLSDIPRAAGNPERAAGVLGWKPEIAWEQTLADVLQSCREQLHEGAA